MKEPQTHRDGNLQHNQDRVRYPMSIVLEMPDLCLCTEARQKTTAVVVEMGGSDVQANTIQDLVVVANFPHRRYRSVEKAVAAAVSTLPVERTTVVAGRNPYGIRKPPGQYRRRDEEPERKASLFECFFDDAEGAKKECQKSLS